jgi:hypothetical protein
MRKQRTNRFHLDLGNRARSSHPDRHSRPMHPSQVDGAHGKHVVARAHGRVAALENGILRGDAGGEWALRQSPEMTQGIHPNAIKDSLTYCI